MDIVLTPLQERDKEKFIKKIQIAFKKAVAVSYTHLDVYKRQIGGLRPLSTIFQPSKR